MQLEYIDENLNFIMQNVDNVLYIRPYTMNNKQALFAVIKEEQGVYKKIKITKEQSKMTFPFEPLYYFYKGPGYLFLNNFICFNNILALNKSKLDGFKMKEVHEKKIFPIEVYATFNDGSATFVIRESKKKFEKHGGIEKYIDLIKQYKEYCPKYDTYEIIECHTVDANTSIISTLQEELAEENVKKLIPYEKR